MCGPLAFKRNVARARVSMASYDARATHGPRLQVGELVRAVVSRYALQPALFKKVVEQGEYRQGLDAVLQTPATTFPYGLEAYAEK
jgi:hypothetical protein